MIRHHVLAVLDESAPTMAVFFQEIGLAGTHGRAGIDARRARYQDAIVGVFRTAAEHGVIRTVDARVTAFGIMGMGNWLHRWYRPDGGLAPEAIADHFADVVLRGLLTRPLERRSVHARPAPALDRALGC
jgi:TetR/AcrR family transcriptional regulator, cholesterol catabolism regulator